MKDVSRRTVARGAAWAVPSVAIAGSAPALAASPTTPSCPTCLVPGNVGGFTAQAVVANNRGALIGNLTANINARGCDLTLFKPAYTIIGLGASLTMSDGRTYSSPLGVTAGAGTLGRVSALNSTFTFGGVRFPDGTYSLLGAPVTPKQLCVSFRAIFIGLPRLIEISCEYSLCYNVELGVSTGIVGALTHAGTINYTGTLDAARG